MCAPLAHHAKLPRGAEQFRPPGVPWTGAPVSRGEKRRLRNPGPIAPDLATVRNAGVLIAHENRVPLTQRIYGHLQLLAPSPYLSGFRADQKSARGPPSITVRR
jgi:hypothetical protein